MKEERELYEKIGDLLMAADWSVDSVLTVFSEIITNIDRISLTRTARESVIEYLQETMRKDNDITSH